MKRIGLRMVVVACLLMMGAVIISVGKSSRRFVSLACASVGGSLLSIGSAAGVGMMGVARGQYTFANHLKWTPVIALGYGAGIVVHFLINTP